MSEETNNEQATDIGALLSEMAKNGTKIIGVAPGQSLTIGLFGGEEAEERNRSEVLAEIKERAVKELAAAFKEMLELWPNAVFETMDIPMDIIFQNDWALGAIGCPRLPEDRRKDEPAYTAFYKALAETFAICPTCMENEEMEKATELLIDNMFELDPTIGMNLGTSIGQINTQMRPSKPICPSFVEYARRYLG